jgi:hypothetical protein
MDEPDLWRVLSEDEAIPSSFHDSHVSGFSWRREAFTFAMDLQYIVEWISPDAQSPDYRFRIARGRVVFADVDALRISMDWSNGALDAQIAMFTNGAARTVPSGKSQRQFTIEFSDPDGVVCLWSTGYRVELQGAPVLSTVTSISSRDSEQGNS